MNWNFLDVAAVEALHEQQIIRFGGSFGLRDAGLLASAVARAENKATYEPEASLPVVAASLAFGLIKNHAFIDGNKRIGLVCLAATLDANGYQLTATVHDQIVMVKRVAASEMGEAEWTAWVERSVALLP